MFMFYWYNNIVISDVSNLPSCQGCHVSAYVTGCAVEVKIGPAHVPGVPHNKYSENSLGLFYQ